MKQINVWTIKTSQSRVGTQRIDSKQVDMTLFQALSSSLSFLKPNKVYNVHNRRFTVAHHCQKHADLRLKGYLVWFCPASEVQKITHSTPASQQSSYGIKFTVG